MPKIYEYLGIVFLIYTNDHEPIHVHAQRGEFENKVELIYTNGKLTDVRFKKCGERRHSLPKTKRK